MKKKQKDLDLQMMRNGEADLQAGKHPVWKPFWHLVKSVRLPWLLILICIGIQLSQSYLELLFPQYTEEIFNGNISKGIAITAVLVVLGKSILTAVYQFIAGYTSNKNLMSFQCYIWKSLSRLPLRFFEKNEPRNLISRTTADTQQLSEFLSYQISNILSTFVSFFGAFILIFGYDWRLAASQMISLPLCYLVGVIAGRIFFKFNGRIQGKLSDMTRYFSAVLPYITLVKLFGQEQREVKNGGAWIEKYAKSNFDYSLAGTAVSFANTVTTVLQELIVILMGVWLVQAKVINIGVWIAFYQYANTMFITFQSIMGVWQSVKRMQGACIRISRVTDEPKENNPGHLDAAEMDGDIAFKDVSFGYQEKRVLKNVSFQAEKYKLTALVGPSGAGKTTILSLLERFYEPEQGQIYCGDHPITDFDLYSWRRAIGYVPQDSRLLSGTIRDNITYGVTGEATDEQVIEAAKQADAYQFIMQMPDGFQTLVGENGAKLSGGQRQRIAIARALLKKAKVLVMDEATSNLDAESESQIEETLKKLRGSMTILLVAHHMDTVRNADRIVVLDQDGVQGIGSHDELMHNNKLYQQLVEFQSVGAAV